MRERIEMSIASDAVVSLDEYSTSTRRPGKKEARTELINKMMLFGAASLADDEIVALLLGTQSGSRARALLDELGGISSLASPCVAELAAATGISESAAATIVAAAELKRRLDRLSVPYGRPIHHPRQLEEFLRSLVFGAKQEQFIVIGLDSRLRVQMVRTVGLGTLSKVEVHPRELFRPLIRAGLHSCIIAHNHPSGDASASESDIDLTERMVRVGVMLGIPVVDHVIITDSGFCSLAQDGLMPTVNS